MTPAERSRPPGRPTPPQPEGRPTPPQPEGRTQPARPAPQRTERRIYAGNGVWLPADGSQGTTAPAAPAPAAAGVRPAAGTNVLAAAVRIALSLPIVWGAAVAAGAAVYLLGLAIAAERPDLSRYWLVVLGFAALVAAAALCLACGLLLQSRPHDRPVIVVLGILGAGMAAAVVAALLVAATLPVLGAAALLGYAALVLVAVWLAGRSGAVARRPQAAGMGRPAPPGGGSAGSAAAPARMSLDEKTRPWSWDRPQAAGDHSGGLWALRLLGALAAAACAVLVGFVCFSLAAESFVSGQEALGWQETLLSVAVTGSGGRSVVHVLTLLLANLGAAALFGVLTYAAARCAGAWRDRLQRAWAIVLAALVVVGIAAWLLDSSLPK